jgi:hypothetical protein
MMMLLALKKISENDREKEGTLHEAFSELGREMSHK